MREGNPVWTNEKRNLWTLVSSFVLMAVLMLPGPASAQNSARQDALFDAKLSYSAWDLGDGNGTSQGWDVAICPPWPPWPPRPPRPPWPPWPPRLDFRISYYEPDEGLLTRAIPLELGILVPISRPSRVTPYIGAGVGYYLLDGKSPSIGNEVGAYGVLGADIRLGRRGPQTEPWGLSIEVAYRELGGDLDLGGPAFKVGLGVSF